MSREDDARGPEAGLAAALRRAEEGFREFIDRSPDAVFVRRGQTIVHANPALLKLLGRERHEVEGSDPATAFVHPAHRDSLLEHRVRSPDATDLREVRWVRKDGRTLDVEIVGVTVTFEGAPARICLCRDLTERKRMQARLMVAGHMAAIGTLAAGIAHELNNPLSYMIPNLRQLAKEPAVAGAGELRELVNEVLEGAERVRRIVDGLRTFSRTADGRRERLELARVLEMALELASGELHARARLVKDLGEAPPVEANQARLVEVLVNLLVNAAHAIPEGHRDQNEIRVQTGTDETGRAVAIIRDTGVGIPPDQLTRIFDPFFTTGAGRGVGLGLSICHALVAKMGGEITVASHPGEGSTFTIALPAAAPPPSHR